MEKNIWTDRVRNYETLYTVKEERSNLQIVKRRKANWNGHILRGNCLLTMLLKERQKGSKDEEEDVSSTG